MGSLCYVSKQHLKVCERYMHVLQRRIYDILQWVSTSFSIGQLRLPGDPILPKLRKGGGVSGGGVLTPLPFPPLCSSPVLKRWDAW